MSEIQPQSFILLSRVSIILYLVWAQYIFKIFFYVRYWIWIWKYFHFLLDKGKWKVPLSNIYISTWD